MSRAGFTLDLDRCTGCSACRIACRIENQLAPGRSWRRVRTYNRNASPAAAVLHYSLSCNHCTDPPCLRSCPAAAYRRDQATGSVVHDASRCIGCRYCSWVCPYGAPQYNVTSGLMEKCTFCVERLHQGRRPACVDACPVGALGVTDHRQTADEPSAPGLPSIGTGPALTLSGPRRGGRGPEMIAVCPVPLPMFRFVPDLVHGLRSEWNLLLLTFTASCLVAWFTAAVVAGISLPLLPFTLAGAAAAGLSTLHLGRPLRAAMALRGLRRSWVSREVFFFSAFFGLALVPALFGLGRTHLDALTVLLGWSALVSIDMVYRVRGQEVAMIPHSALTTISAALLTGLLMGEPILVVIPAVLKVVLYLLRRTPFVLRGGGAVRWVSLVRMAAGFVLPLLLWLQGTPLSDPLLLAPFLLGELLDRAELYGELRFLDPELQIERDLSKIRPGSARQNGVGLAPDRTARSAVLEVSSCE